MHCPGSEPIKNDEERMLLPEEDRDPAKPKPAAALTRDHHQLQPRCPFRGAKNGLNAGTYAGRRPIASCALSFIKNL